MIGGGIIMKNNLWTLTITILSPIITGGTIVICYEQFILNKYSLSLFLLIIGFIIFHIGIETHEN